MIEHRNVYSFICWCKEEFKSSKFEIVYASTSICFDLSVYEIFYPLTIGKKVRIVENGLHIGQYLSQDKDVLTNSVPTVVEHLLKEGTDLSNISVINMAGEPIPLHVQQGLDTQRIEVRNLYGPTEDTTYSTIYKVVKDQQILIGKPIANTSIYVLNNRDALMPVGVPGEICIGGDGLARGYLNRADLTAEKFIKDPFSKQEGARLYKTGDIGRWLPDGNIEYLGRMDDQVKIRGYRIELGEIESVLMQSELVGQAVVIAKTDSGGNKRLVAYVVTDGALDKQAASVYLQSKLPDYMVPALWVEVERLPLTPNGKIDKKALPDVDASDILRNEYLAPRNETEEKLAAIWKELLHVERVGIEDNFFELGGDSILTIQVVSRANRSGYNIQPRDIFIHQTISRLSSAIVNRSCAEAMGEQGVLTGVSGLLPIQQWYLQKDTLAVSHFNQSVLLSIDRSVTQGVLAEAVRRLLLHHDGLRLRYYKKDEEWQQEYGDNKGAVHTEDLRSAGQAGLSHLIGELAGKHQRSLDIEQGEMVRVVLIQTPEAEASNRILIIIHHLAIDGVSWRILLEDLDILLTAITGGQKAELGSKTSSLRQWYNTLQQYGQSKRVLSQKNYWQQVALSYQPLVADKQYSGEVRVKDIGHHVLRLGAEPTRRLLQEVPRVYHTQVNDILLAALCVTICRWSGTDKVIIGLEGHGREAIAEDIDTSRTAGWFTTLYPVLLKTDTGANNDELIKTVKEQLRQVPDKGLGYGVLKYINKEEALQGDECWDIVFNYLGQLDNVVKESRWLSGAGEAMGASRSEELPVSEKLSVNGMVQSGELVLYFGYSSLHYHQDTVIELASAYISNIEGLIEHCLEQHKVAGAVYTPSDYGLEAEVSYSELDKFLAEPFKEGARKDYLEGMYRLSGLQEGMLFHSLYNDEAGAYIEQLTCDLGKVNLDIISKSWDAVIKRHTILRSAFYPGVFSVPVQCVYRQVELPVEIADFSTLSSEEQQEAIASYEASDRVKGFDFKSVPLMRLGLLRINNDRYRMVWTSHHILFDGWSLPILMEEFLTTYETLLAGQQPKIAEEDRYEDYIRYIERSNKDQEEAYWRNYLKDIEHGTLLPFIGSSAERNKGGGRYKSLSLNIDAETTAGIQAYAQKQRLTVNTLMQGVWSKLLHHYTGHKDVVYGIITSGRPNELAHVEQRVGMYINTLPLRAIIDNSKSIGEWLQGLQSDQVASRQYQHTPLHIIQRWSGVTGDLFDSLLVFENYPVSKVLESQQWNLQVGNVQMHEQTNYPLSITIASSGQISIG